MIKNYEEALTLLRKAQDIESHPDAIGSALSIYRELAEWIASVSLHAEEPAASATQMKELRDEVLYAVWQYHGSDNEYLWESSLTMIDLLAMGK